MIIIYYYIENATTNPRITFQRNIWTNNAIEIHIHMHTHTDAQKKTKMTNIFFKELTAIEMNKQWMKISPCRREIPLKMSPCRREIPMKMSPCRREIPMKMSPCRKEIPMGTVLGWSRLEMEQWSK